jgi:hypothetical protein
MRSAATSTSQKPGRSSEKVTRISATERQDPGADAVPERREPGLEEIGARDGRRGERRQPHRRCDVGHQAEEEDEHVHGDQRHDQPPCAPSSTTTGAIKVDTMTQLAVVGMPCRGSGRRRDQPRRPRFTGPETASARWARGHDRGH